MAKVVVLLNKRHSETGARAFEAYGIDKVPAIAIVRDGPTPVDDIHIESAVPEGMLIAQLMAGIQN